MKGRENLIKADKIWDKLYFSFVNGYVTKRKFDFFDPIKKINPEIGLKKTKKIRKSVSIMKEIGKGLW